MGIQSFGDRATEQFFTSGTIPKGIGWANASEVARRKLDMLNYSHALLDLRSPPGNRLEALKRNLRGFHSIRVNDKWRIIFRWSDSGPSDVQIVDYHN